MQERKTIMDRRTFIRCATLHGATAFGVSLAATPKAWSQSAASLNLEPLRQEYGFPGIAAAGIRDKAIVVEGAAGIRRVGADDKITLDNRFAMASCTKRMTAAMIARLVDSGRLSFDTTLAEALPDIPMRDDYRGVTVAQLLKFQGGIQPYLQFDPDKMPFLQSLKGSARERREAFLRHVLQEEPVARPGTERHYSNASYALVALVAERRTGKSWESLMESEVFQPLGMTTAGCGRPRSAERPSEPTLHSKTDSRYEPEPDDRADGMLLVAPAGDVHCSIRDFAKFAIYELSAARGNDMLLKPATAEHYRELSNARGPLIYPKAMKMKLPPGKGKGEKKGPQKSNEGRNFFGGSNFVSAGCMLWPEENLAAVAAINAGSNNEAIRIALNLAHQAMLDRQ
jgi:CubicO group peptidase (beta-lactamase class C family)